jgi:hypothetical protein
LEGFGLVFGLAYLSAAAAFIAYLWNLHSLLHRCAPENRALRPGLVWLQLVPVFGALWQFFVVGALPGSVEAEYRSRGLRIEPRPTHSLGLVKAIVDAVTLAHVVAFFVVFALNSPTGPAGDVIFAYLLATGGLLQLASTVLWAAYWGKVSMFSNTLLWAARGWRPRVAPVPLQGHPCWNCGSWAGNRRFCTRCGARQA